MPNSKEHFWMSALLGLTTYAILKQRMIGEQINAREAIGVAFLSGAAGMMPDALEPADSPQHRRFFHSCTGLGTLVCANEKVMQNPEYTPQQKALLAAISVAYASHIIVDSTTPAGIPIL